MKEFGTKVMGEYKISSMPFSSKDEAYKEINDFWNGVEDVTTWYDRENFNIFCLCLLLSLFFSCYKKENK